MSGFPLTHHSDDEYFGVPARLELLAAAAHIMVVDDEEANVFLLKRILKQAGFTNVTGITNAMEVEVRAAATPPDLVLIDVHMPGRDGFEVLEGLSPLILSDRLPVIVMTGDMSTAVRREALSRGARDFVTKPFDLTEIGIRVRNQLETRLLFQDLRKQNRALSDTVRGRTEELESTRVEMIERIAITAEYRDDSTNDHNGRVGKVVGLLAAAMGETPARVALLARAAALHDVGKIGVPDALLRKPGPLTEVEVRVMQTHTLIGARILGGSDVPVLQMAESIALTHHERWDGKGYPRGLVGEAIPIEGRLVAVADTFDAMTTDRPYRRARSAEQALQAIQVERGLQFDSAVVDGLMRCPVAELMAVSRPTGAADALTPAPYQAEAIRVAARAR